MYVFTLLAIEHVSLAVKLDAGLTAVLTCFLKKKSIEYLGPFRFLSFPKTGNVVSKSGQGKDFEA